MQTDSDSRRRLWPHTHPARAAGMAVDGAMYVAADVQLIVGVEYRAAIDISARSYAYLVAFGGPLQSREPPASRARGARASLSRSPTPHSGSRCDRAADPRKRYGGGTGAFRLGRTAVGGMVWAGHIRLAARLHKT
jgi:hypothetical protein